MYKPWQDIVLPRSRGCTQGPIHFRLAAWGKWWERTSISRDQETCPRDPGPPCQVQSPRQLRPFFGSEKDWKRLVRRYQILFHRVESTWLCRNDSPSTVTSRNFIWMRFNICIFFENNLIDRSWKEGFIAPENMVGRPWLILVETAPQLVLREQSLSVLRPFEAWNCKLRPASNISFVLEQSFFLSRASKSHEAHRGGIC